MHAAAQAPSLPTARCDDMLRCLLTTPPSTGRPRSPGDTMWRQAPAAAAAPAVPTAAAAAPPVRRLPRHQRLLLPHLWRTADGQRQDLHHHGRAHALRRPRHHPARHQPHLFRDLAALRPRLHGAPSRPPPPLSTPSVLPCRRRRRRRRRAPFLLSGGGATLEQLRVGSWGKGDTFCLGTCCHSGARVVPRDLQRDGVRPAGP